MMEWRYSSSYYLYINIPIKKLLGHSFNNTDEVILVSCLSILNNYLFIFFFYLLLDIGEWKCSECKYCNVSSNVKCKHCRSEPPTV